MEIHFIKIKYGSWAGTDLGSASSSCVVRMQVGCLRYISLLLALSNFLKEQIITNFMVFIL